LAFAGALVGAQQGIGHHKAQHPVAQKFKPLVVGPRRRRDRGMGQRAQQQFGPGEHIPQPAHEGLDIARQLHSIALKKRSARQVQKKNSDRPADENITRSARPIRYSAGTKPSPPAAAGKRLSSELSRLSPMKKYWPAGTVK